MTYQATDASELEENMSQEALLYDLSVALMRLDGNEGDPHQLVWCGGTVPEPWGDVWQKYEPQAQSVLNAIGESSARALVAALPPQAKAEPAGVSDESKDAALAFARDVLRMVAIGIQSDHIKARDVEFLYSDGPKRVSVLQLAADAAERLERARAILSAAPSTGVREDAAGGGIPDGGQSNG